MNNHKQSFDFIYANWFDSEHEADEYVSDRAKNMDLTTSNIREIFNSNRNDVFVKEISFIDLDEMLRYDFTYTVNNGVYDVAEKQTAVVLFYEYCFRNHFDLFKMEVHKNHKPKFLAKGFVSAIHGDNLDIVKYFLENELLQIECLYNSPLYEAAANDSVNCFMYLADIFLPDKKVLPSILHMDAKNIMKYIITRPTVRQQVFEVADKSWVENLLSNHNGFNESINVYSDTKSL